MTRAELMKEYFGATEWCICKNCIDALRSRGEKVMTSDCVIPMDELGEFIEDGGFAEATDGTEPIGCEWCEEIDDLYEVVVR